LDIDLTGQRDVAVESAAELPFHLKVVGEILPAVAGPHVAAGAAQEAHGRDEDTPGATLVGSQYLASVRERHVSVVVPPAHLEARREQREKPQPGEHGWVGLHAGVDEHAVPVRGGDDVCCGYRWRP
jgi:hypothetical protein